MECTPIPSDQLVEQLFANGHVTTRRPHHGLSLALDMEVVYGQSGLIYIRRDQAGLLDFGPNVEIVDLCQEISNSAVKVRIDLADNVIYESEPYRSQGMTYRKDLYEGIGPKGLIQCITGFDAYAICQGPNAPALFTSRPDEICNTTAYQIHCTDRRKKDSAHQDSRLLPDEQDLEWMTNLLRLRSFLSDFNYVDFNRIYWLYDGLVSAEKWLSNMSIEIDGTTIDESCYQELRHIDSSRVTISTILSVMLDTKFYRFIAKFGVDVERRDRDLNFVDSLRYLENRGFKLSQFHTK